jgi:hypothetical protein
MLHWVVFLFPPALRLLEPLHEIMPHVLDRYDLSLEDEPVSERPAVAIEANDLNDLFDVMISCLESALAG